MKPPLRFALATVSLCCISASLSAFAADRPDPPCPLAGWEESLEYYLGPTASVPTENPDGLGSELSNCKFHQWSWEIFTWATALDSKTKKLRLESIHKDTELNGTEFEKQHRDELFLRPRFQKPGAFTQAQSGGILVDQHGQAVWYSTHMNDKYFDELKKCWGPDNYKKIPATETFPVGSAVFKASWQIVGGIPSKHIYTTTAHVPILYNDPKTSTIKASEKYRKVTVALVGLHVVGVTHDHPEFVWGTFEHYLNTPDLAKPGDFNSPNPVSNYNYSFYRARTAARDCNRIVPEKVTSAQLQTISPKTSAMRRYSHGGGSPEDKEHIINVNKGGQHAMKELESDHPGQKVFANYRLIGTVWQAQNILQPGDNDLDFEAIGSVNLANSTMETYRQGPENNILGPNRPANCFQCHHTGGRSSAMVPGKDVNLSHLVLGSLGVE